MKMKCNWKRLILCLLIPLGVGGLSALLSMEGMKAFSALNQPPLSPPAWVFPIAWTILYLLMGLASYLVVTEELGSGRRSPALFYYAAQLVFNFFWSLLFFRLSAFLLAFFWLIALWVLILVTLILFFRVRKAAGWLMLPYLLWVTFAGYLNLGIFLLNR